MADQRDEKEINLCPESERLFFKHGNGGGGGGGGGGGDTVTVQLQDLGSTSLLLGESGKI